MIENWCVIVFRNGNYDFPCAILGPYDSRSEAHKHRTWLPEGFLGHCSQMQEHIKL